MDNLWITSSPGARCAKLRNSLIKSRAFLPFSWSFSCPAARPRGSCQGEKFCGWFPSVPGLKNKVQDPIDAWMQVRYIRTRKRKRKKMVHFLVLILLLPLKIAAIAIAIWTVLQLLGILWTTQTPVTPIRSYHVAIWIRHLRTGRARAFLPEGRKLYMINRKRGFTWYLFNGIILTCLSWGEP